MRSRFVVCVVPVRTLVRNAVGWALLPVRSSPPMSNVALRPDGQECPSYKSAWAAMGMLAGLSLLMVASVHAADRKIEFNRDVRPILSNNCYLCHGPDQKQLQAGLRLDKRDSAVSKLESGKTPIVPNDISASEIIKRITSADPTEQMPPKESGKSLTADDIETLKLWVAQGAEYQGHWSFLAAERREPPVTKFAGSVKNPIDNFVLAKLEQAGLEPSPEADKFALIRRATLDLTGLPPTPLEVDAFLADASAEAY